LIRALPFAGLALSIPAAFLSEFFADKGIVEAFDSATRHFSGGLSRADYFMTQIVVIPKYMLLMLFPLNLTVDHYVAPVTSASDPRFLVSALFLASLILASVYSLRLSRNAPGVRFVSFGILWLFLAFGVDSSFFPTHELMVEYRTYLPSMGFFISIVAGLTVAAGRSIERKHGQRILAAAFAAVLVAASVATYSRNAVWQTEIGLWDDAVAKAPLKSRPYNNRGHARMKRGEYEMALLDYGKAIALAGDSNPLYPFNRAALYLLLDRPAEAHDDLTRAIRIDRNPEYFVNRGRSLEMQARLEEALADYETAIELTERRDYRALNNRASVLMSLKRYNEALLDLSDAIALKPDSADVQINAALSLRALGHAAQAVELLSRSLKNTSSRASVLYYRGLLREALGDNKGANLDFREASGLGLPEAVRYLRGRDTSVPD
jgi:tetratricopeptide (TPR) repeat protein